MQVYRCVYLETGCNMPTGRQGAPLHAITGG